MFLNIQGDRSDTPHVSSQSGGAGRGTSCRSKTAVEKSALLRRWYTVTGWLGRIRPQCVHAYKHTYMYIRMCIGIFCCLPRGP